MRFNTQQKSSLKFPLSHIQLLCCSTGTSTSHAIRVERETYLLILIFLFAATLVDGITHVLTSTVHKDPTGNILRVIYGTAIKAHSAAQTNFRITFF
jgi:hypothetical protein